MARALSNSTTDAASSPATEPTTATATEPTTASAPAPAPAPSPAPAQPPTATLPPPPTPAAETATAPVMLAPSSRGASVVVTVCATPGCSRPHRYWKIDQAFLGVRVCCSECTSNPSSSLFATGNDHGHTMECNVAAAARRQERSQRSTVQPSAPLPAPTPAQAPAPPPTPSPAVSSSAPSSGVNSSTVRSRRATAREHQRAYEQWGLANGVSEEEMVAHVMALTAVPEGAPDTGLAARTLTPTPAPAPAPTPAPAPAPTPDHTLLCGCLLK